jgi:uncharacterized protein (DUF2141 family)
MRVFIALLIAFGVSLSTMAAGERPADVPVSIRKVDDKKVQLLYGAVPEGPVTVRIFDEKNFLVKTDRIRSKSAFARYYDFSQLKAGKYTLEVIDSQNQIEKISVNFSAENTVKPVGFSKIEKVEKNSYKLTYNAITSSDVSIFVYENDKLIHEEKVDNVSGVQKLYKLVGVSPTSQVEFFVKTEDGFSKVLAAK